MNTPSRKRAAAANTLFGGLQTIVAIINGMVLVPIYLHYLSPTEYGTWLATGNVLAWLTIIDPGVGDLARQRIAMFYGARRWDDACSVIWTGGLIVTGMAVAIAILAQVLAGPLIDLLCLDDAGLKMAARKTLSIAGLGTALLFFAAFVGGVIQSLQRTVGIGIVALVGTMILPITRLLLLQGGHGIESLAWGMVAHGLFVTAVSLVLLAWRIASIGQGFHFGTAQFCSVLGLSAFTSLQRVASVASTNLRGVFITRLLGPETTVVFEMSRAPLDYARTFLDKPMSGFTPAFAHLKGEGDTTKIETYTMRFVGVFIATLALCLAGFISLNQAFVSLWLGEKFFIGSGLNALLAVAFALAVIVNAARGFLYAMGEIKHVSVVIVLLSAATVTAQYIGLRSMGLPGLLALPITLNLGFSLFGFPKRVVTNYVGGVKGRQLLKGVLLPACLAGVTASAVGAALLRVVPAVGWLTLSVTILLETGVYTGIVLATSSILRAEAAGLLAALSRTLGRPTGHRYPSRS
jgi:O-antigen/teichoic acid export membrane protein